MDMMKGTDEDFFDELDRKTEKNRKPELISLLSGLKNGCGSHSCEIAPPVGMGTNGVCHCVDTLAYAVHERLGIDTVTPNLMIKTAIKMTLTVCR